MLLGSMFCYLSFEYIGSEVLANGVLVEPFFLIPIGYMLAFIGILLLLISLIRKKVKNK
ncbi:MAG: DUF3955 domain-containing protein [SAR324 cluster bacterium]|nr:DUF3955 domain-containing protein [SAR324 cluster bacterium]